MSKHVLAIVEPRQCVSSNMCCVVQVEQPMLCSPHGAAYVMESTLCILRDAIYLSAATART
eukprot:925013-Pyramimonas_sp.AAC.1